MKMSRVIVGCLVLVLVVGATASAQQQKGRRGGVFGFDRGGGRGQSLVGLAAQESVQKDLGLAADAAAKVGTLNDEYRAASQKEQESNPLPTGLRDLGQAERAAKMQEYTKKANEITAKLATEYTPKLQTIVGADAIKRLKQIQIQSQGAAALTSADVVSELKLTDEQKKKLEDLNTEYQTKQRELFTAGGDQQERTAKQRELGTEQTTKAVAILTAEQKDKFTALKGKTFDVSTLRTGRGRRGGNNNN